MSVRTHGGDGRDDSDNEDAAHEVGDFHITVAAPLAVSRTGNANTFLTSRLPGIFRG